MSIKKNLLFRVTTFLLFLAFSLSSYAQRSNEGTEFWVGYGHHQGMVQGNGQDMVIYINNTSSQTALVEVRLIASGDDPLFPIIPDWVRTYTIPAGKIVSTGIAPPAGVGVTWSPAGIGQFGPMPKGTDAYGYDSRLYNPNEPPIGTGGAGVYPLGKAIRILSMPVATPTGPKAALITAYAHIYEGANSGATMLMPKTSWGYNYTSMNSAQSYASNCYSWMYIMAASKNTRVRLTSFVKTKAMALPAIPSLGTGLFPGVEKEIILDSGQIYQVIGANSTSDGNGNGGTSSSGFELTGATVYSVPSLKDTLKINTGNAAIKDSIVRFDNCQPIAVFSGSSRTQGGGSGGGDNDNQQLPSQDVWGKSFLIPPLSGSNFSGSAGGNAAFMPNGYRIVIKKGCDAATTVVKRNGVALDPTTMVNGQFYYFESAAPEKIESNQPIMIAQFIRGGNTNGGEGDPDMLYLSPIEQGIRSIGFFRNDKTGIVVNFLTMVVPTAGMNSLNIDGSIWSSINAADRYTMPHPQNPNYTIFVRRWAPATQVPVTAACDSPFTAVTYGLGSVESYAFSGGTSLNPLRLNGIHNPQDTTKKTIIHPYTCKDTETELSAWLVKRPFKIEWKPQSMTKLVRNAITGKQEQLLSTAMTPRVNTTQEIIDTTYYNVGAISPDTVQVKASADTVNYYTAFSVLQRSRIDSVKIFPMEIGKTGRILITTNLGIVKDTIDYITTVSGGNIAQTVYNPNAKFLDPGNYRIRQDGPQVYLQYSNSGAAFPYTTPGAPVTITGQSSVDNKRFYHFFNWSITSRNNSFADTLGYYTSFTLTAPTTLNSVKVFPMTAGLNGSIVITDNANNPLNTTNYTTAAAGGNIAQTVAIGASLPAGTYRIKQGGAQLHLQHSTSGITYPYSSGPISITGQSSTKPENFYYFYDWSVTSAATNYTVGPDSPLSKFKLPPPSPVLVDSVPPANNYTQFKVDKVLMLKSVDVYPYVKGKDASIRITDTLGNLRAVINYVTNVDSGHKVQTVPINLALAPGYYRILQGRYIVNLASNTRGGGSYPYTKNSVSILRQGAASQPRPTSVYNFYNWQIAEPDEFLKWKDTTTNLGELYYQYPLPPPPPSLFKFTDTGIFRIPMVVYTRTCSNCVAEDSMSIEVIVRRKPQPQYTWVHSPQCPEDTGRIVSGNQSADWMHYNIQRWFWETPTVPLPGVNYDTVQGLTHFFNYGTNQLKLSLVTDVGCTADTVFTKVVDSIRAPFKVLPSKKLCLGDSVKLIPNSTVSSTGYMWDYGDGTKIDTIKYSTPTLSDTIRRVYTNFGKFFINLKLDSVSLCVPRSLDSLVINDTPHIGFVYPIGCLPTSKIVPFTDTTRMGDTTTVTSWIWSFGEPTKGAGDTSFLQNPTHLYDTAGTYHNLSLTVISSQGCRSDSVFTATFNISPDVAYLGLPDTTVCENVVPFMIDGGYVTNNIVGTGIYKSVKNAVSSTGLYDPSLAGPGIDTVSYIYTATNGGCTDTSKKVIRIFAKPQIGFVYSNGCLPTNKIVNFTDTTKLVDTTTIKFWTWSFGEPTKGNNDTSHLQNPTHQYDTAGIYSNLSFSVISSQGCRADSIFNATFNISPSVAYGGLPDTTVCENIAPFNIANGYVLNGIAGTSIYKSLKNAVTSAGVYDPAIAGYGKDTVWYIYTATNSICSDTAFKAINIKPRPRASFSISPTVCLPVNGNATFTSSTFMADGSTLSYAWNFNAPSTVAGDLSNLPNPVHSYGSEGPYDITLTVNSSNGCKYDTAMLSKNISKFPDLTFPALDTACGTVTAFSFQLPNVTVSNGVSGTGVYSSYNGNVSSTGLYTVPANSSNGVDTVYYTFTSTGGCATTVKQPIVIRSRPFVSFKYDPANGCLPTTGKVDFTSQVYIPQAGVTVKSYAWNFNDPSTLVTDSSYLPNPTYNYTIDGLYTIKLKLEASNGCKFDTSATVRFSKKPELAFLNLADVCENDAPFSVAKASVTNGATGTGVYSSLLGNVSAAGIYTIPVGTTGYFTDSVYYKFTSTGGCDSTIAREIKIKARPRATFVFDPLIGCIPASGKVDFKSTVSIPQAATSIQSYAWNFNDPSTLLADSAFIANPSYNYASDGPYTIKLHVAGSNGCSVDTSVSVTFNKKPALAMASLADVCENAPKFMITVPSITNGATGTGVFSSFKTGAITSAGEYTPAIAGVGTDTIYYRFTSTGGCDSIVKQKIVIKARPFAGFKLPVGGCLSALGTANFTDTSKIALGNNITTWSWNFGDPSGTGPNTSVVTNPSHNYSIDGSYTIKLNVTANNGCVDSVSTTAVFNKKPALSMAALADVCENANKFTIPTPSVTNGATGMGVFSSFKTGSITSLGEYDPSIAGVGVDTVYYKFISTGGCDSIVKQKIVIKARPKASFTYPIAGCLPTNGAAQFYSQVAVPVGVSVQSYTWDFGDPTNPPNTSNQANPLHYYTTYQNYTVKLTVVANNGCSYDTAVTTPFNLTPALNYGPIIAGACANLTNISVASGSITNGVVEAFHSYKGNGIANADTTAGIFNPSLAGNGLHTITYRVTSVAGCTNTATATIRVFPKPQAKFTINDKICADAVATIKDFSTVASGTITSWNWEYDDGTPSTTYYNNATYTKTYNTEGQHIVKLYVVSDSACSSDIFADTTFVHPIPVADFSMPASVCMPNGTGIFTNLSTISDNSLLTYKWVFGDLSSGVNNTSNATNPSHTYSSINSYNTTLTVTSLAGCISDTTKVFDAFFDKPIALFTVSTDTVCQGAEVSFIDKSSAPNSSIKGYLWNFDDGTVSLNSNPGHVFINTGKYNVTLQVTNSVGCISDIYKLQDSIVVYLQPIVDAGPSFVVPENTFITFNPTTNDSTSVSFVWSPAADFTNPTILRPTIKATHNDVYTLTVTGKYGCTATDTTTVKILKSIVIPNAFSPNGDGINDKWVIPNLKDYPGASVEVFNRGGQRVYLSNGYSDAWDGTKGGASVPVGTYYYIIKLKNGFPDKIGYVVLLR